MKNPFVDDYGLSFLGFFLSCIGILIILWIIFTVPLYYSSCREASVYNRQNDTNWTCSDFFWAGNQINSQSQTVKVLTP